MLPIIKNNCLIRLFNMDLYIVTICCILGLGVFTQIKSQSLSLQKESLKSLPLHTVQMIEEEIGVLITEEINKGFESRKLFKIDNNYLFLLSKWATGYSKTVITYFSDNKVHAVFQYDYRIIQKIELLDNNFLKISFNSGCCDQAFGVSEFFYLNNDELFDLVTIFDGFKWMNYSYQQHKEVRVTISSKNKIEFIDTRNYKIVYNYNFIREYPGKGRDSAKSIVLIQFENQKIKNIICNNKKLETLLTDLYMNKGKKTKQTENDFDRLLAKKFLEFTISLPKRVKE